MQDVATSIYTLLRCMDKFLAIRIESFIVNFRLELVKFDLSKRTFRRGIYGIFIFCDHLPELKMRLPKLKPRTFRGESLVKKEQLKLLKTLIA